MGCCRAIVVGFMTIVTVASPAKAGSVPSWSGYGSELELVDTVANGAVDVGAPVVTGGSAAVHQIFSDGWRDAQNTTGYRPATDPDGADYFCAARPSRPTGHYDSNGGELDARVEATVGCNFTSPHIVFKVQFEGYDPPSGSFVESGLEVYCTDTDYCVGAVSYHRTAGSCQGRYEHYGVPYGSYKTPDGVWHRLVGDRMAGPSNAGGNYSEYC